MNRFIDFRLGGLQIGGGINDVNALDWLSYGASKVSLLFMCCRHLGLIQLLPKVIVTSFLFPSARFALERLKRLSELIGGDKLVVDIRYGVPKCCQYW